MDLEKLIKLVLSNPDYIKIEYSNIDGQETLKINDKEISQDTFDDSYVLEKVQKHKAALDELDDCLFGEVLEILKENNVNLKEVHDLIEQEHYTESKAEEVLNWMEYLNQIVRCVIDKKLEELSSLRKKF